MLSIFIIIRAGGEDSAFSNTSIIHQLREQVSHLQAIVPEKEENEKAAAQKLAMYQNQLHAKNPKKFEDTSQQFLFYFHE